jgi:TolB-like protein/CRP-like cAMP-binding protein
VAPRQSALLGLQKIDLFQGLDVRSLREIAAKCRWARYKRNQAVVRRGDTDRNVYFVIAGLVRVVADAGARRLTFRDVEAGGFFGEHAAIDARGGFADAVAVRESVLASMPPEVFRAIVSDHASVRERLLRTLAASVRELADRVLRLSAQSVQARIRAEVLRLAWAAGVSGNVSRIEPAPTHADIASRVGTSREQVTRELSRLAREGILARRGRALIVQDVPALENAVPESAVEDAFAPEPAAAPSAGRSPRQRRAILVADILDPVAMMERDEELAVNRCRSFLAHVTTETVPTHAGRSMLRVPADGLIAEFPEGLQALRCAFQLHHELARFNANPAAPPLAMRVGIHVADVIVEAFNVLGDGVNVAARLAELANPGETLVSVQVRDQLTSGVDCSLEDLGEQRLRGRNRAVRAFRVWPAASPPAAPPPIRRTHGRPSIAVVPFRMLSGAPGHEMLGDGLAEETIAALSRVADFFVVSRLSSMAFRGRAHGAQGVGELLGVQYVVSGTLQTTGSRALLLAELADARDGRILWSERIEGSLVDLFAMQADLARRIVERVAPFVRSVELQRARITRLDQLDAFGLLMRGIELMHKASADEFRRAQQVLEASIQRDPTSALPYAWLAKWHVLRIVTGASPDVEADSRSASQLADRALEHDAGDPVALAVNALVDGWSRHDLDAAEARLAQALSANPSEPLAWLWNGITHAWRGRGAEAVRCADLALSLSPLDPMTYYFHSLAGTANLVAEDYPRAIELAERSLRENALHTPSLRCLAVGQVLSGRMDEARVTVRRLREMEPRLTVSAFRDRYPGRDSVHAERFAAALGDAGLPA